MSRLTNDIDALDQLVTDGVTSLVTNSLTFVGAIVFLFILDWRLALATLAIMPFLIAATLVFRASRRVAYALVRNRIGDVSAHLQESISGVRVLKAFRREQSDYEQLDVANAAYRDVNYRTVVQSGLYFPFVEFMSASALVIVLWYGGSLVTGEALQVGVLVAFIGYLSSFFDPLQQLSQLYNTFQSSMAAVQKIYTVLDTDARHAGRARRGGAAGGGREGRVPRRHVRLRRRAAGTARHRLRAAVRQDDRPRRGDRGGQVDHHQAACPLLRPHRGRRPDRRPRPARRHPASLRDQLAVVPQEAFLFSGSVLDNIRFARPTASEDEVKRVARIVGVHDFVESLPDGYETEVQEGGSALSTGQRQLVSFARALLADPRILILDEATSSVDAESERRIERAMEVLFSGRTSVIVAHRLSTVRYADEILVVDDGRIVERGTHDQLVSGDGRYAALYREWEETGQAF